MSSLLDRAGEGFKEQVKARAVKEFMTGDYPASAFSTHWRQICWFWRVEVGSADILASNDVAGLLDYRRPRQGMPR
ncbi:hypothetical protein [Rhodococcus qingshengii]|uniref:hypothetical protein n=1 Tax=Rhodococcus qingshengii TaxID=334542 RepID=UPI001C8B1181|nr:hypothetical protein [Rhodococcus qingshengii]MBX9152063.1 hypothetical protein [Rhodococcus qingshengii]